MSLVEVGRKAPAFSLPDQDGTVHRPKDYAGRALVVYFCPKDDTPGRTREACAFRDAPPGIKKGKAAVLGVSVLDVASKAKFARKHRLSFPLLADPATRSPSGTERGRRRASTGGPRWGWPASPISSGPAAR